MYSIQEWSEELDLELDDFYKNAQKFGFENNSCRHMLVDCFREEKEWNVWLLYYNNVAVGSVAAHSFFNVMGENSYRIAVRTCAFTSLLPISSLRTYNQIVTHQNVTGQFLIPACIEWCPPDSKLYITTNSNDVGRQKLVHKIFTKALESTKQIIKTKQESYRDSNQTIWKLDVNKFYEYLNKNPRWK